MRRSLNLCVAVVLAVALAATSSTVIAGIVFSDDFNSANGPLLGTTADVGGTWTQTGTSVVNPIQISGNAVALMNTGQDAYAALSSSVANPTDLKMRTSVDINVSAANATGDYFLHVSDPVGTTFNFYQRLFARSSGGGFQLGLVDTSGTGSTTTWGTTVLSLSTSYHVDVDWMFVPGATNDTFAVSVDNAPYLAHTWTSATSEPAQISAVNFRQGSASNAATLSADNLVVAVIPEPSALLLATMIGVFGLLCRRPKR